MTRDELCDEWKCRRSAASIASPGIFGASRQPNLLEKPEGAADAVAVPVGGGDDQEQPAQAVGRGGQAQGPVVAAGRYRATLATVNGESLTAIGQPQTFAVVPLPR